MCGVEADPAYGDLQTSLLSPRWDAVLTGGPEQLPVMKFSDDCPDPDPQFHYELRAFVPKP